MASGTDEATAILIADLLKVAANPNRLRILYLLAEESDPSLRSSSSSASANQRCRSSSGSCATLRSWPRGASTRWCSTA